MNKETFWKIMADTREESEGDPISQQELLTEALRKLDAADVIEFQRIFEEYSVKAYTWKLWGAAYIIHSGCSDDGFMDFRGWLIAQGEEVYTKAVEDPDSLADLTDLAEDEDLEGFGYVAFEVYDEMEDKEMPDDGFPEEPDEPEGEEWEEDELETLLPRLSARFAS